MDKADEIRNRKGYARWEKFQRDLSGCLTVEEIMVTVHLMLDGMNAYGSHRASGLSKESLAHLVIDRQLDKFVVKYVDTRMPAALSGEPLA